MAQDFSRLSGKRDGEPRVLRVRRGRQAHQAGGERTMPSSLHGGHAAHYRRADAVMWRLLTKPCSTTPCWWG